MIAQTASKFYAPNRSASPLMGQDMTMRRTCAVQLFDRRTGRARRINGTPLVIYTRNPSTAVEGLLEGRDPTNSEARIHEIEAGREP